MKCEAEDLISRADVNRIICEYRDDATETGSRRDLERAYGANAVGELISKLPSVYPKSDKPSGKWIPVSEKLPSDCDEDWVLVQIQEDNGYLWIPCVAEYRKNRNDWWTDHNNLEWISKHDGVFKVVAWMPLPKRYKESKVE